MLKKILVIAVVAAIGLIAGYNYTNIYNFIWPASKGSLIAKTDTNNKDSGEENEYISRQDAVNAVKQLPYIEQLVKVAQLDASQMIFLVDDKPTKENPVWMVQVEERHPDKVPVPFYIQVDAKSGNILDLQEDDFEISGIKISMTRQDVEQIIGEPDKNRRVYDKTVGKTIRVYEYPGLEVKFDRNGKVIKITSNSADFPGPRGIKVDDTKKDVITMLGKAREARTNILVYNALSNPSRKLIVNLIDNDKVSAITIE